MFIQHVAPRLMDERTLSPSPVPKRMRHAPYRALCSPYSYIHQPCYWFGLLFEQDLENYMLQAVQPGDTVMDVGMNVGHVSVLAAGIAGLKVALFPLNPIFGYVDSRTLKPREHRMSRFFPTRLGRPRAPRLDPQIREALLFWRDMSHEVSVMWRLERSDGNPRKLFLKLT
jgi:hypothetical protein